MHRCQVLSLPFVKNKMLVVVLQVLQNSAERMRCTSKKTKQGLWHDCYLLMYRVSTFNKSMFRLNPYSGSLEMRGELAF